MIAVDILLGFYTENVRLQQNNNNNVPYKNPSIKK